MRRIKILFMQLGFHKDYPDVSTMATTYNDGIYYVASFIMEQFPNVQVDICQMFWQEDPATFPLETYDYIMVSALATHFWSNLPALELINRRKQADCIILMGGPHAAFAPYEALKYADYVVLGEGEVPTVQLIEALESGGDLSKVDNLCYIGDDNSLIVNQMKRYGNIGHAINPHLLKRAPRLHWATVSMSRGCPFDCSFCYAIRLLGRRFRTKNVQDIRLELDGIYQQTGCSRFYVTDLNFTTKKDFCHSVAETFRDTNYKFIAMSRVEHIDNLELVLELKKSGFEEYCLGVESENPAVLDAFNKRVNPSQQQERLLTFAENGIYTHSAIIYGLDQQDRAAIENTARWCADARIMHPTFVCLAEYPFQNLMFGARQDVEDHRIIMEVPTYQHYSFVGIFPHHMRPSQLQRAILDSYSIFFKHAYEVESKPQRRMRLKSYERSTRLANPGMERHIRFLEKLEKPYYKENDTLKEDLLKADFEDKYGSLREWLGHSLKKAPKFTEMYAK